MTEQRDDDGTVWVRVPARWITSDGNTAHLSSGGQVLELVAADATAAAATAVGDVAELATLPVSVRRLVHAADALRDKWAEAGTARRDELWRALHTACEAVWDRPLPDPARLAPAE